MFLLVLSAATVLQQPPQNLPDPADLKAPPPAGCRAAAPVQTAGAAGPGVRKLGDLPPGRLFHTVLRSFRGCDLAEVYGIGPDGKAAWVWEPAGPGQVERALPTGRFARRGR